MSEHEKYITQDAPPDYVPNIAEQEKQLADIERMNNYRKEAGGAEHPNPSEDIDFLLLVCKERGKEIERLKKELEK